MSVHRFTGLITEFLEQNIESYKDLINDNVPMVEIVSASDLKTKEAKPEDLVSKLKLPHDSWDSMSRLGCVQSMAEVLAKGYFEATLRKFFALVEAVEGSFPPLKKPTCINTLYSIMDRSPLGRSLTIIHPKTMAYIIESSLVNVTRVFTFDGYASLYTLTNIPYDRLLYVDVLVCEGSAEGVLFTLTGDSTEICFDKFELEVKQVIEIDRMYRYLEVVMHPYINFQNDLLVHKLPE